MTYKSILVVNALNGSLPLVLRKRYPSATITCAEAFPFFRAHLAKLGFEVTDWDTIGDMKFDLVIGNPPYQNTHGAKRWPIWHDFVVKSIELSSQHVVLVTPSSWIGAGSYPAKDEIWNHLQTCNLDVQKYFDVGSTFSWFQLDVTTHSDSFELISDGKSYTIPKTLNWLPAKIDLCSLSINSKVFNKPCFEFRRGECHTSQKHKFGDTGWRVFHTHAQELFYVDEPANYKKTKVAFTLSGDTKPKIGSLFGMSQATAYAVIDKNHKKTAQSVFGGKLFQWILQNNKWSGWNSLDVIKQLPHVDLDRSWTDQQLYQLFDLSAEEISYVETHVK